MHMFSRQPENPAPSPAAAPAHHVFLYWRGWLGSDMRWTEIVSDV